MLAFGKFEQKRQVGIISCVDHVEDVGFILRAIIKILVTHMTQAGSFRSNMSPGNSLYSNQSGIRSRGPGF